MRVADEEIAKVLQRYFYPYEINRGCGGQNEIVAALQALFARERADYEKRLGDTMPRVGV